MSSFGRVLSAGLRHIFLIVTGLTISLPFIWMISLSARSAAEIFDPAAGLLPRDWSIIQNYSLAVTEVPLLRFLLNGVIVCSAIALLQLILCAPLAYALAKHRFRARPALLTAVIAGLIIPQSALSIPLFMMCRSLGLLNSYGALILPFAVTPFGIFLLRQAFQSIPNDVIHAARLDGLSELSIVWRIMIPMALPAVTSFVLLIAVAHWNDLYWPMIAIRSQDLMPPALGVVAFRDDAMGQQYGVLMAAAVLVVAPVLTLFISMQRFFVGGTGAGAVK